MKTKRTLSRLALARRLQDLALRIAAGRTVRVGRASVRVPAQVVVEEEVETTDGQTELELEVSWTVAAPAAKSSRRRGRHTSSGAR